MSEESTSKETAPPRDTEKGKKATLLCPPPRFCLKMALINEICDLVMNASSRMNLTLDRSISKIAVVGSQSDGKSSVEERLIGQDFLPKGCNMVTRTPIQISLIRVPIGDSRREKLEVANNDWVEFEGEPGIYTDFGKVSKRINELTDQITGNNQSVSQTPIIMSFFSANVTNLTLIDLPGLIENVDESKQPADTKDKIEAIILNNISHKNTIILAVLPANTDPQNWKALNFIKKVDPTGGRTVGALTKIDSQENRSVIEGIFSGETVGRNLGMIGIRNRTSNELNERISIARAAELERQYFAENYPRYAKNCGIDHLADELNRHLLRHIKDDLPDLIPKIQGHLEKDEEEIRKLGAFDEVAVSQRQDKLIDFCDSFAKEFRKLITSGRAIVKKDGADENAPCSTIMTFFQENFETSLKAIRISDPTPEQISRWIANAGGIGPPEFIRPEVLEEIIEQEIERYLDPSRDCLNRVHNQLLRGLEVCNPIIDAFFQLYPQLKRCFRDIIFELLGSYKKDTLNRIENFINAQASYIDTSNPTYSCKLEEVKREIRGERMTIPQTHEDAQQTQQTESVSFSWNIKDIFSNGWPADPTKSIMSKEFSLKDGSARFKLRFNPAHVQKDKPADFAAAFPTCVDLGGNTEIPLRYKFWAETQSGDKVGDPCVISFNFKQPEGGTGWRINHTDMLLPDGKTVNNNLVRICFKVLDESESSEDSLETLSIDQESKSESADSAFVDSIDTNLYFDEERAGKIQVQLNRDEYVRLIKKMVPYYMSLVRRNIQHNVPTLIAHNMIMELHERVGGELGKRLKNLSSDQLEELFREDEQIATKRQEIEKEIDILRSTLEKIKEYGIMT